MHQVPCWPKLKILNKLIRMFQSPTKVVHDPSTDTFIIISGALWMLLTSLQKLLQNRHISGLGPQSAHYLHSQTPFALSISLVPSGFDILGVITSLILSVDTWSRPNSYCCVTNFCALVTIIGLHHHIGYTTSNANHEQHALTLRL